MLGQVPCSRPLEQCGPHSPPLGAACTSLGETLELSVGYPPRAHAEHRAAPWGGIRCAKVMGFHEWDARGLFFPRGHAVGAPGIRLAKT